MRDVLVLIFWFWCAASVVILLRRLLTTGSVKSSKPEPEDSDPEESFEARLRRGPDAAADPDASDGTAAAGNVASTPPPSAALGRAETLAEALEGISLPNGLAPVVSDRVDPRNMLFSSSGHPPEAIGGGLADELERLGYAIQPVDDETIHALKAATELQVRIHPDLERARMRVGAPLATLPERSVVVQMRLR